VVNLKEERNIFKIIKSDLSLIANLLALLGIILVYFIPDDNDLLKIINCLICLVLILGSVLWRLFSRKTKLKINVVDKLDLEIFFGETESYSQYIFSKDHGDEIFVVPVNCYFDTHVHKDIIQDNSIIGSVIQEQRINENQLEDFDSLIEKSLQSVTSTKTEKKHGKKKKYPIGTVAKVQLRGRILFLLALTDIDEETTSFCTEEMFHLAMNKLILFIDKRAEGRIVNLPLLGSGNARLQANQNTILNYIIDMFLMSQVFFRNPIRLFLSKSRNKTIHLSKIER
jgi:hypothetical protein